ncbi:MAG: DNA methyltransferase, partial [Gammaproteobacteria bacterium]|nr:DNA methyltransferase [Gammaproteobacteria bacterium]MDE0253125.1 DNA methyltransferase [Gammaproteobacteria bacterium]MDE0402927.1 DNA methyltransferase [Gammaproteobacteria bacterium]
NYSWLDSSDFELNTPSLSGIKGVGKPYNYPYLAYMAIRLIECHRVLKTTGSIYLHCDPTMSHYLKTTMDCIFDEQYFRNEIVWSYPPKGKGPKNGYHRKHDIVLFYSRGVDNYFDRPYTELNEYQIGKFSKIDGKGQRYKEFKGRRTYLHESAGRPVSDSWSDIGQTGQSKIEYLGYPTQKPIKLLQRIINASSPVGGWVLDPFCGCATTCEAAEHLGRKWIGVDISIEAYRLVKDRLLKAKELTSASFEDRKLASSEVILKTNPPTRTDLGKDYREQKFVYVISHPKFEGHYKVGIAKDVKARLNSYQTSDPERQFQLRHSVQTPHFRELERYIHSKFENKHEWVSGRLDDIKFEIDNFKLAA